MGEASSQDFSPRHKTWIASPPFHPYLFMLTLGAVLAVCLAAGLTFCPVIVACI